MSKYLLYLVADGTTTRLLELPVWQDISVQLKQGEAALDISNNPTPALALVNNYKVAGSPPALVFVSNKWPIVPDAEALLTQSTALQASMGLTPGKVVL